MFYHLSASEGGRFLCRGASTVNLIFDTLHDLVVKPRVSGLPFFDALLRNVGHGHVEDGISHHSRCIRGITSLKSAPPIYLTQTSLEAFPVSLMELPHISFNGQLFDEWLWNMDKDASMIGKLGEDLCFGILNVGEYQVEEVLTPRRFVNKLSQA